MKSAMITEINLANKSHGSSSNVRYAEKTKSLLKKKQIFPLLTQRSLNTLAAKTPI
jgi:hypothetical protein